MRARSGEVAAYFEELGRTVRASWLRRKRSRGSFSDAAAAALTSTPPPRWPLDRLVEGIAAVGKLPRQAATDQAFGQPPVTMFWDTAFRIDLLFWHTATVGIHQHQFSGAFTLVSGASVESGYAFTPIEDAGPTVRFGLVEMTGAEMLQPGDVQPIPYGEDLVHSVVHLDAPTVTLVVRTPQDRRHGAEFEYKPPYLAIDPSRVDPTATKKIQLLAMLLKTQPGQYVTAAEATLAGAELHAVYRLLEQARLHASEAAFEHLMTVAARRHPVVERYLRPVLEDQLRRQLLLRRRAALSNWDHRFLFALLVNMPSRRAIERIVSRRYPAEDPLALIERWVGELSGVDRIGIELDEPLALIFRHLLHGQPIDAVVRSLKRRFSGRDVDDQRAAIEEAFHRIRQSPILSPLFS